MRTAHRVLLSVLGVLLGAVLLGAVGSAYAQIPLQFVAVTPCRVVDTRKPNGPFGGPPITGGTERSFTLPNSPNCNISSSAAAYSLNVTVVPLTGSLNYLTVWPTGQTRPAVSTLNSYDGRIKANAAIVPGGTDGAVSVYATDTTQVILDIDGYFIPEPSPAWAFYPLPPCRVADTRNGQPLQAGVAQNFPVQGVCDVSPSALAYSLNFTVLPVNGQPLDYLTVWPAGQSQPLVSTLNAPTGTYVANAAIVQGGTGGEISVYATNETNLLIDVNGYFAEPGTAGELALYPLTPCRVLDTRPHSFQGDYTVNVESSGCSVPASAQGYVVNATVVPQGPLEYLTLWPDGHQPTVSTLNAVDGAVTSNMAIVGADVSNGTFEAYASNTTNLIVDIFSYLATTLAITTTSLPQGAAGQAYSQTQLAATGGMPPYSWSLSSGSLPPGLTLSPTGVIAGTPIVSGAYDFIVQVSDTESNTATAHLSITIQTGTLVITTMSLPDGTVSVPYSVTLGAAGGAPPYSNWTVVSGSLPAHLSLSTSGVISGTPSTTGSPSFTVQVEDSHMQTAQAELSITINAAVTNAVLSGHYALMFNGYENGNPVVMAAAFVADGNGNLTSGFLDLNDGSGETISDHNVIPQTLTTGSVYSLAANGLGTMTIVTNLGTYKFSLAVVSASACMPNTQFLATCGRLIQRDSSNPHNYGSGVLKVQNPEYFPVASFFPGNFTLLISGTNPSGNRYAAAGALGTNSVTLVDIDCSSSNGGNGWGLTGCPSDIDDAGQIGPDPVRGTFSSTIDQSTGRGEFVDLTFPSAPDGICTGAAGSPGCTFAYYIVDKEEMILISADPVSHPANLVLWSAFRQSPPEGGWSLSSLSQASVLELNAADPNGGSPVADITAGVLNADGSGSATFYSDENQGGTLNLGQASQGSYAIDSTGQKTGRMTLSGFHTQFGTTAPVIYLIAPNYAYVVGTDAKVSSGILEAQSGSPFSNASVISSYAGGSTSPVLSAVVNSVTSLFADGAGNITATQYTSGPAGPGGPINLTLAYQVDATGRAVVEQSGNQYGILYAVSPSKVILLPGGSNPALDVFTSGPSN